MRPIILIIEHYYYLNIEHYYYLYILLLSTYIKLGTTCVTTYVAARHSLDKMAASIRDITHILLLPSTLKKLPELTIDVKMLIVVAND